MPLAANRFYVYTYSYPDGTPFYVGKGTAFRFKRHLTDVKYSNKADTWCKKVIKSLLNKGQEPIIKKIVENIDNEFAVLVEQEYIAKYGRKDLGTGILVNCTSGGDGGIDLSPEIKAKHIERIIKVGMKTRFKKGLIPWNKGGHHSEKSNEKNRQSHLGKTLTEEHKRKVSEGLKKVSCATRFKKGHKTMFKQITCPHCNKTGISGNMHRWHMDNCKFKENT
jgi:hypothetical protein